MSVKKVLYEELLPHEFIERINACPVAYLPLGTLEWHGRHLPLGADSIQAKGVFEKIASEVGGIVLPALFLGPDTFVIKEGIYYYGMDYRSFAEETPQQLAGSAYYIDEELFGKLLDTIMYNLSRAGFKVVVGHGHGPSTNVFSARKQIFKDKFGLLTYTLFDLGYRGPEGIQTDHAATNETSLVMALRPELVDMEKLAADSIPVGVWGKDPRKEASAERGNEIIDKNVKLVCQKIKEIMAGIPRCQLELDYKNVKSLLS